MPKYDWRNYEEKTRDETRDALLTALFASFAARTPDMNEIGEKLDEYVTACIEKVAADNRRREMDRD